MLRIWIVPGVLLLPAVVVAGGWLQECDERVRSSFLDRGVNLEQEVLPEDETRDKTWRSDLGWRPDLLPRDLQTAYDNQLQDCLRKNWYRPLKGE